MKTSCLATLACFLGLVAAVFAQATKPAPATPIDVKKAELGGTVWNPAWGRIVEKAIPPEDGKGEPVLERVFERPIEPNAEYTRT